MSWGIFDFNTHEPTDFDANSGHFQSLAGHRYLVVVRAQDDRGVQKMTLEGSGNFQCATNPDEHGVEFQAPHPLPASILHHEFNNSGVAPTLQELVVIMNPDIGAFEYDKLSCGFHHFGGTPGELEYFAFDGLMTFSATSENTLGFTSSASLTTSPQP